MTEVKSDVQEDPLFSFKNFVRPTSKNVLIWGTVVKTACITLIGFSLSILATSTSLAIALGVIAILIGGLAESIILFTREKPVDTLVQAVEDVIDEKDKPLLPIIITQPLNPVYNEPTSE